MAQSSLWKWTWTIGTVPRSLTRFADFQYQKSTTALEPGEYVLKVFAEDYHGNRTTRDLRVVVAAE